MVSLDKIPVPNYKEKSKKTKKKKKAVIVKYIDNIISNDFLKKYYLENSTKKNE